MLAGPVMIKTMVAVAAGQLVRLTRWGAGGRRLGCGVWLLGLGCGVRLRGWDALLGPGVGMRGWVFSPWVRAGCGLGFGVRDLGCGIGLRGWFRGWVAVFGMRG